MLTTGDLILYFSVAASIAVLVMLLLNEFRKDKKDYKDTLIRTVIYTTVLLGVLLTSALLLLTYYFIASDFTYEYVWEYSSRELPLIYKISGVWAGQPGTYLLWVWIVYISAMWLSISTGLKSPISRRTQILTVIIGIYFIAITLMQSPFKSIYEYENVLPGFIPPDGSGLNALLINFWMVVHPPLMFIGYGAMTVPFAAALVYLITRDEGWEILARQWTRFTWLFLGLGIAVGGLWAYLVLGWGGFWSWDPVETSSLIPWLTLTGYLHAASMYRKNKNTFAIASPMLAAASFALVVYAAMVTRSGLFNSVHAFGNTSTGPMLLVLILVSVGVSVALGLKRYLEGKEDKAEEESDIKIGDVIKKFFVSKNNVFYLTLLLFVLLSFVSFWGITFPVIIQLTQGVKVGIASDSKGFFNVWSFPFTILLLISLGFCLRFKKQNLDKELRVLLGVVVTTIIAGIIRIPNFYVLDHTSPFFVSEPAAYKFVGSISLLAMFPGMIYALIATYERLTEYAAIKEKRQKVKGIGISLIHFGVVLILIGAVISASFTQSYDQQNFDRFNVPLSSKGSMWDTGVDGYSYKLLDYRVENMGSTGSMPGTRIGELLADPVSYESGSVQVSGKITKVVQSNAKPVPITYMELNDDTGSIWIATEQIDISEGAEISAAGMLMKGFKSNSTGMMFDYILFSGADQIQPIDAVKSGAGKAQIVELEVYKDGKKIGGGTAEYVEGKGGSATHPMVDRGLSGDVYVIFQGVSGGLAPLTLKIIPAINYTWIGVILFAIGIIMIMGARIGMKN